MNKAILLDRDGVITKLVWHEIKNEWTAPWTREEFEVLPHVDEALKDAKSMGFFNLIITNQPDVLDGFISVEDCVFFSEYLKQAYQIDEIFEAYSRGDWKYKPNPGFIDQAKDVFNLDLSQCFFIGDRWKDCVCAAQRKVKYIHVGDQDPIGPVRYRAKHIGDALQWIRKYELTKAKS